jgi:hypothetical protein
LERGQKAGAYSEIIEVELMINTWYYVWNIRAAKVKPLIKSTCCCCVSPSAVKEMRLESAHFLGSMNFVWGP